MALMSGMKLCLKKEENPSSFVGEGERVNYFIENIIQSGRATETPIEYLMQYGVHVASKPQLEVQVMLLH